MSLSLVKLKNYPALLKMNSTTDIYSEFSKIFRTTISRGGGEGGVGGGVFLLKYFAGDYCLLM